MIEYKDTTSKELRLAFAYKDLDVEALDVIDKRVIDGVEMGILGASHYLKVGGDKIEFTEVFSCAEFDSKDTSVIQFKDVHSLNFKQEVGDWKYEFESISASFKEKEHKLRNMLAVYEMSPKNCILFEFPYEGDPLFTPITLVMCFQVSKDEYLVQTVHAYPDEDKLVFTQSKIKK